MEVDFFKDWFVETFPYITREALHINLRRKFSFDPNARPDNKIIVNINPSRVDNMSTFAKLEWIRRI